MGDLFVPFFGYFYDQINDDLAVIHNKAGVGKEKKSKRQVELNNRERVFTLNYAKSILKLLEVLYENDP